jgi:trimeric autotransporter adhesin
MKRSLNARLSLIFLCLSICIYIPCMHGQGGNPCESTLPSLTWTGAENNDFFNEKNWKITNETASPTQGSLDPGTPIQYSLIMDSGNVSANGSISFACITRGMTLNKTRLDITSGTMSHGVLSLNGESTVHFRQGIISANLSVNFLDAASWVYMHQQNPDQLATVVNNIKVNNAAAMLDQNFRINQYYQTGALIRPISSTHGALIIYKSASQQGVSASIQENTIYKGSSIPGGMDNATASFRLKRGYMATLAVNSNGTGKSRVYIASESDLLVDNLDVGLQANVSFIRVVPWNWTTKKGTGGFFDMNPGWYYNWNNNQSSKPNTEYVPMAWGASGTFPAAINQMIQNQKATQVLGFNESDNCSGQSGQYNNLCQPAVAVGFYESLMSTGLRLGTPAPRENGPTTWLRDFAAIAKEKNVRFDFVAVHWYDWGINPQNSPNADAQQIFNRFKSYLQNVYNIYQLPIWITEFNANDNRGNPIQEAFLQLALPYLESLDYVERYAYFQPVSNSSNYFDGNNNLTNIGQLYKNHISTPSITKNTYVCPNNLDLTIPQTEGPATTLFEFEAEEAKLSGSAIIASCINSSKNGQVNMATTVSGVTTSNGSVTFEDINVQIPGTYSLKIAYMSKDIRTFKLLINGKDSTMHTIDMPSGNWCFVGTGNSTLGIPRTLPDITVNLNAGLNKIEYKTSGNNAQAPIIDKITLQLIAPVSSVEDELNKNNVKIYPNPSSGMIIIGVTEPQLIIISDLLGRVVRTMTMYPESNVMDVSDIPGGIYNVKVGSNNNQRLIKL